MIAGKKAFITGGAQGLGVAAARRLAKEGAHGRFLAVNLEGAPAVAAEIDGRWGRGPPPSPSRWMCARRRDGSRPRRSGRGHGRKISVTLVNST